MTIALDILAKAGQTLTRRELGAKVGYSPTAITLYMNGKYPGGTARLEAAVIAKLGGVDCPFLGRNIPNADCAEHATRECPSTSPLALRHWQACKGCEHNPNRKSEA